MQLQRIQEQHAVVELTVRAVQLTAVRSSAMGQSVSMFFSVHRELSWFVPLCQAVAKESGVEMFEWPTQICLQSKQYETYLIVRPSSDEIHAIAWEEIEADDDADERFRNTVRGMTLFDVSFRSLESTRHLLALAAVEALAAKQWLWIDTQYGWTLEAQDFLNRLNANPQWDWRYDLP